MISRSHLPDVRTPRTCREGHIPARKKLPLQSLEIAEEIQKQGVENLDERLRYCYASADNLKRLERVMEIAKERNVPVSVPVLAYLLNNKLPCIPVFGATAKEMVYETLQAVDFEMTAEESDALWHCCH